MGAPGLGAGVLREGRSGHRKQEWEEEEVGLGQRSQGKRQAEEERGGEVGRTGRSQEAEARDREVEATQEACLAVAGLPGR